MPLRAVLQLDRIVAGTEAQSTTLRQLIKEVPPTRTAVYTSVLLRRRALGILFSHNHNHAHARPQVRTASAPAPGAGSFPVTNHNHTRTNRAYGCAVITVSSLPPVPLAQNPHWCVLSSCWSAVLLSRLSARPVVPFPGLSHCHLTCLSADRLGALLLDRLGTLLFDLRSSSRSSSCSST